MADGDGSELPDAVRAALLEARPDAPGGITRRIRLGRVLAAALGNPPAQPTIGRFLIEEKIGEGGMGTVYRARDPETDRLVAIKLLDDGSDGNRDRFAREARILAELSHPAIVRYVAHGHSATGEPYLAMEWLDGEDLAQRLRRQGLTVDETVQLAIRMADALAEAHGRGIVHRDLKPANVFLPGGQLTEAKLLDFGIARPNARSATRLTQTGMLIGTPSYMAPEQVRGAAHVDARVDVFALGCTLYECLAGRPAFVAEHLLGVLARVLFQEPPRLAELRPEVPAALDTLVTRLLTKDPAERPSSAAALALELRALGSLAGGAPPTHAAAPILSPAEQRVVSVVMVGHAESGGDDQLRAIARQHGASLERVTGATLVAALSARGAAVDQAADAARLGLALRGLLPAAAIAVTTGRGVVGGTMPVGDAVDRGAHLLDRDQPGVWLDDVTAALLEGQFELDRRGARARLVAARPADEVARTLLGRATPCVGREHELALLDAALADSADRPAARAVLVTAPSGVGKSRLLHEWRRRLAEREPAPRVLASRGEPMSSGAPYLLAAQLVRRATAVPEGAPAAAQRAALAVALAARGVADADRPRVVGFLGELLGLEGDPAESEELRAARSSALLMSDQIRLAWEDWLHAECAAGPVVLVLEDLHWGDAPSVRLVDAALRSLRDQPLLIVALARREVHELFPALWSERGLQELRLPELSRRASEELARAVLGPDADPGTVAWISVRAGGHALYLEEVIRAVVEGHREGVPASVLAMVQVRLAALTSDARRVLRAAAIFGDVFWRGAVAALVGRSADQVAEVLEELVSREAISPRRATRFPGEAEYAFRHALFREAAASMLTEADRTLGHRLAADWLIAAGERQPLVLAEHLERGGAGERAIEWYVRAAEHALRGNDLGGALARAGRAQALGASGELLGRLRLVESEAHTWVTSDVDAEATALEAIANLPPRSPRWFDALRAALNAKLPARRPLLDQIVGLLDPPAASDEAGLSFVMAATVASKHLSFHGEHERAWQVVEHIEAVGRALPPGDVIRAWTARARASAFLFDGRHDGALAAYLDAARLFHAVGDLRELCSVEVSIGWLQATELGLHAAAEATLRECRDVAERVGLPRLVSLAKQNLGVTLMHLGQFDEARALIEETVAEFERADDGRLAGGSRFYLTILHTVLGDPAQAEREALAALELAREVPTTTACVLAAYARALVVGQRPTEALERARAARTLLDDLGGIEEGESLILLALAEALHAAGQPDEARATIATARDRLEARAARMTDHAIRRGFLEAVPEHARTLELARIWAA